MLTRFLVNVLSIGGLALAGLAGLGVLLISGRRRKRAILALAVTLTALSGCFWTYETLRPYQLASPAPVDNALTISYSGQDCNGFAPILPCESERALYALRVSDGSVRWRRPTPGPAYFEWSAPILRDGVLYTSSADSRVEDGGVVAAIRASDGAVIWRVERSGLGILQLAGDSLFLLTSHPTPGAPPQQVTQLDVLRLSDGTVARSTLLPPGDGPVILDGQTAYRCQSDGELVALRLSDGRPLWSAQVDTPSTNKSTGLTCVPTVVNGVVYVHTRVSSYYATPGDSSIVATRASDGRILWRYHTGPSAPLSMSGGMIFTVEYLITPPGQSDARPIPPENVAIALRASDGALVWRRSLGASAGNTGMIMAGRDAVYAGLRGTLIALRATDGARLWRRRDAPNRAFSVLAALDSVVFVQSSFAGSGLAYENGFPRPYLLALRPSDGALYWQTAVSVQNSLAVAER